MVDVNLKKASKPIQEDMSALASQSRKHLEDNPLLDALTLVIESNAEYAKGVTTILDADLEREVLLNEIQKDIANTKKIMDRHTVVLEQLIVHVNTIKARLETIDSTIADELKELLAPLYIAADLQESGLPYNPTDKLVVTFQKVLSSKLFTMIAGVLIWVLVEFLFKGIK